MCPASPVTSGTRSMAEFDGDDCLARYFERVRAVPNMLHNPPGKIYEILSEPREIRRAAAIVRDARRVGGDPAIDTRVGVLAEDPYVTVIRDAVRFPDGDYGLYYRLVLGDGVVMLPVLGSSVVLVNAFRHGTRTWHLEAPRGMFDAGEPVSELIRRELDEEIGAAPIEMISLGALHPSPGVVDECLHLFLVRIDRIGEVDRHEAISEIKLLSVEAFESLAAAGTITDGPTLGTYLRAKLRGLI
jgi:ADP-ribose pyrophosphatase